jgi:hypothetical protein
VHRSGLQHTQVITCLLAPNDKILLHVLHSAKCFGNMLQRIKVTEKKITPFEAAFGSYLHYPTNQDGERQFKPKFCHFV